jgi:hypothetical protein
MEDEPVTRPRSSTSGSKPATKVSTSSNSHQRSSTAEKTVTTRSSKLVEPKKSLTRANQEREEDWDLNDK